MDPVIRERERLMEGLSALPVAADPSQANFVWLPLGGSSLAFAARCAAVGLSVRPFDGEGVRCTVAEPEANDRLIKFLDCWPPLNPKWRPAPESKLYVDLCDGRIVLAGKVDLALGRAEGNRAGKVLVDLKTGRAYPAHREDLRFYALIEAIRQVLADSPFHGEGYRKVWARRGCVTGASAPRRSGCAG